MQPYGAIKRWHGELMALPALRQTLAVCLPPAAVADGQGEAARARRYGVVRLSAPGAFDGGIGAGDTIMSTYYEKFRYSIS